MVAVVHLVDKPAVPEPCVGQLRHSSAHTVFVVSDGTTYGNCTYTAVPMKGFGIPPAPVNFYLPQGQSAPLWFPGVKLNTTWNVTVRCDHGGPISATTVY